MNKFSQLLVYLLRLSISRTSDPLPEHNETKEQYIQRFNNTLLTVLRYPDLQTRTKAANNNWYLTKFIETQNKIQEQR